MNADPVIIFVNGIMHEPGSADSWVRRAATAVTAKTEFDGISFLYEAGALTRRFTLNKRARELADLITQFKGHELHLCVHSNGAEVLSRALRHLLQHPESPEQPHIASAHFVGPANDADFTKNWLNSALITGLVREVYVYKATEDKALKWGRMSRKVFGWIGLGYGDLGIVGPQNVSDRFKHRVHTFADVAPCHTCFFDGQHFTKTIELILDNARLAAGRGPLETRA